MCRFINFGPLCIWVWHPWSIWILVFISSIISILFIYVCCLCIYVFIHLFIKFSHLNPYLIVELRVHWCNLYFLHCHRKTSQDPYGIQLHLNIDFNFKKSKYCLSKLKTAKIESYRLPFVSYRFATETIGIESFCNANSYYYKTTYLCIVFSNFRKKKWKGGV